MGAFEVTDAELTEGVEHLRRLIQIDTSNPPGNELAAARYLEEVLRRNGIPTEIVEPTPGRAVLHARIRGNGSKRPVLLTAHMDVVGADRSEWSSDPFGAEIRDGVVYGRGAIDDKGMLAANLMAFLKAKRRLDAGDGLPDRDIVFLATSDEESGGRFGIPWVIEHHPEFVDAEFAINEGGRVRLVDGKPRYAAIQTAEKIPYVITMRATGPGGHASVPLDGTAIGKLARALSIISTTRLPLEVSETSRAFFGMLGTLWPDREMAEAMKAVAGTTSADLARAEAVIGAMPKFDALLRHTLTPAIIAAGTRHNVIPPTAEATLSLRVLPGHRAEDVIGYVAEMLDDPGITLSITSRGQEAPASDISSAMFRAMQKALAAIDPEIVAAPYLSAGATESAYLRAFGIQCYGILPFPLSDADESRMHGADERLPIDSFAFGIRFLDEMLRNLS